MAVCLVGNRRSGKLLYKYIIIMGVSGPSLLIESIYRLYIMAVSFSATVMLLHGV